MGVSDEEENGPLRPLIANQNNKEIITRQQSNITPQVKKSNATIVLEKEAHKKKLKMLLTHLQQLEAKIAQTTEAAKRLPFFNDPSGRLEEEQSTRRSADSRSRVNPQSLTDLDITKAAALWRQKIDLHLQLADCYLKLIQLDYNFAEKKGLESLCWKRIYSLVEQFRHALKARAERLAQTNKSAQSETNVAPVVTETGMTLMSFSDDDEEQVNPLEHLRRKEMSMIHHYLRDFLDKADFFYQRLSLLLRTFDREDNGDERKESRFQAWGQSRRLKWYRCVPIRGDLARYRWAYAAGIGDDSKSQTVSREKAREDAWRWYALGSWLMPATGKLYFHLSLLVGDNSQTARKEVNVLNEMHKLYFSTRSLMVRRNGFLNAREGVVVLFENNRRWFTKHLETVQSTQRNSRQRPRKNDTRRNLREVLPRQESEAMRSEGIAGMFVRLHGMLFTKIGLDQFPQVKRRFFDALFPTDIPREDRVLVKSGEMTKDGLQRPNSRTLSGEEMFWFEMAIICISSLHSYDYSSSKLSKLILLNTRRLYGQDSKENDTSVVPSGPSSQASGDTYDSLVEDLRESVIFASSIDLICQIAIELFRRFLDENMADACTPSLPPLPNVPQSLHENDGFVFGTSQTVEEDMTSIEESVKEPWLLYIELLLHWMVVNCMCAKPPSSPYDLPNNQVSLWEAIVGPIVPDLIEKSKQGPEMRNGIQSSISPAFWPLLLEFLNKLLASLPEEHKYDLVNKYVMEDDKETESEGKGVDAAVKAELAFSRLIVKVLGDRPTLPEESHILGLGWVDGVTSRLMKTMPDIDELTKDESTKDNEWNVEDRVLYRKIKVLEYSFALAKQMSHIFEYDPVYEKFTPAKYERYETELEESLEAEYPPLTTESNTGMDQMVSFKAVMAEMDDAVLLSNETDPLDEDDDDPIVTQLKKRREQLQTLLVAANEQKRYGYRKLPTQVKEREARMNHLRENVIPGKTVLILDTNCFIGHLENIKNLFAANKWLIVVPLVVVTELDGISSNAAPLGTVAMNALKLIEETLAKKQRVNGLRVQTSHNNFMYDISIRSEQFVFGETDKNLDDLVLSSCLWWTRQPERVSSQGSVAACLVTGDRNLSVKARARDVEVVPVSVVMQLTPK
ncbi:hypothetical protein PHYBLDRAFT_184430 [Phycomyces blakesleeanus NRRL 1555(-)]|uniref:PIN domain-containing protein n=1 Tax=Phycomyces blakesleeanus (strain ATCC 8743b / DSM 1359 / FGSC 10004 / NBRC 33097 / NRRL 1555) TaxID=763407 RepID=A0A167R319_PHYB8|nr:hypothetical protein PHYBLDRAFT_184430 [Phycomyces blakesleeanus NRRL 1555(-)]OAD80729.1 hypothetical protein PHYBLDRAFT_184430 [Phycomyces blakesleeanus NRRL 1555(-)]|eukprot:XP_018298769.1 hypothetical protein PHYBLDRAFT_184430 [Phycomyces blakesleeanus NRRL 1555(-)]